MTRLAFKDCSQGLLRRRANRHSPTRDLTGQLTSGCRFPVHPHGQARLAQLVGRLAHACAAMLAHSASKAPVRPARPRAPGRGCTGGRLDRCLPGCIRSCTGGVTGSGTPPKRTCPVLAGQALWASLSTAPTPLPAIARKRPSASPDGAGGRRGRALSRLSHTRGSQPPRAGHRAAVAPTGRPTRQGRATAPQPPPPPPSCARGCSCMCAVGGVPGRRPPASSAARRPFSYARVTRAPWPPIGPGLPVVVNPRQADASERPDPRYPGVPDRPV